MADHPYVVFSQRAFNAIVTEVQHKDPVETGGILIGYVLDNGARIVVENIPPGQSATHQWGYFEYDEKFVNYLSNVIARQYVGNLQVLGLWHRHPGNLDTFSSTDDETNLLFAHDYPYGSISALVNIDPTMRITMYHVDQQGRYTKIDWYVDDGETIPKRYLQLWYTSEKDLMKATNDLHASKADNQTKANENGGSTLEPELSASNEYAMRDAINDIRKIFSKLKK